MGYLSDLYKRLFGKAEYVLVRRYSITTGIVGELYENGRFLTHTLDRLSEREHWQTNFKNTSFEFDEFTEPLSLDKIRLDPNKRLIVPRHIKLHVLNRYATSI